MILNSRKFSAPENLTQKMTRGGLVEQNRATGEEHSVSRGERDFAARPKEPGNGTPQARAGPSPRAEKQNPAQHFRQPPAEPTPQAAVPSENQKESGETPAEQEEQKSGKMPARPHGAGRQYQFHDDADRHAGPSKLQFTRSEAPPGSESRKLSKLHRRAQKVDARFSGAREHLPTRRRIRLKHEVDKAGKARRRLRFAKEPKPRNASHPVASLMKGAAGAALMAAHSKIREVERENVGVEAGHRAEQAAEALAAHGLRTVSRRVKSRPYRRVSRWRRKSARANARYNFRKAVEEHPILGSNPLSRLFQKRKIKRQYAKAARAGTKGTASVSGKFKRLLKRLAGPRRKILAWVLAVLFALFFFFSLLSSCSNLLSGGFHAILATSYSAEDDDINRAEACYSGLEADLKKQIDDAEWDHPGYDEYIYQVGTIGHDPHELISYLTAVYNDFTFERIQPVLRQLFSRQYRLSFVPKAETRQRTVTETDPLTGRQTTRQESETHRTLTVDLNAAAFSDVIAADLARLGAADRYAVYLQTRGNRQYFSSPFAFGWNLFASVGADESARIDVSSGTQVLSMLDGTVTRAGGGIIVLEDGNGLKAVYSGCGTVGVRAGQSVKSGTGIGTAGPGFSILVSHNGTALNPILFILDPESESGGIVGSGNLSGSVEGNRRLVEQLAGRYGMQGYVSLILAVMQQESGGRGSDPMQAAEGPYNKKYPHKPGGIADPAYSIQCGIQQIKASLQAAGCTSPTDMTAIALALQGYNFGSGFISWAKARGGYSEANAAAFSRMEAAKLGWSSYGDVRYVPHVLRYYKTF